MVPTRADALIPLNTMRVVKSKTEKLPETRMSNRNTGKPHIGEKQGNGHLESKVSNHNARIKALETVMWAMQVQPSIDAICEPTDDELGDERSVATWENWTESSECGDTVIDDSSPSGTSHDAVDQLSPSSQPSIVELLNPHPTRSLNTTLLQDCITSYPKLFNESYLRVDSLNLAERRLLEPLKLKDLKWRWHPFMDVRNTHRGEVCVRTMDNDVFLRMMNMFSSITFQGSRQKGKSNAPRDPAKVENKPDFSEIEIWGGRVLVWCIVGTTCWYDRHGYAIPNSRDARFSYGDLYKWIKADRFFFPFLSGRLDLCWSHMPQDFLFLLANVVKLAPELEEEIRHELLHLFYLELTEPRMGEAYRECFIKYFPRVGIQAVLTFEQQKARPTFHSIWFSQPIDLRGCGFEIDTDITVSAGQYKPTLSANTVITLRRFAEERSENKICLVKGIFQNGTNKSDVIVKTFRWKNIVLGSDTVTSSGKAVGLNWGLVGGGLAVANLILIEDL
ncbi:hypothetical protein FBULB1_577 [Fusarium bulbicola]|nr:hypothetical protein FBULB1_577 [Fusarium bulbicola]